MVLYLEHISPTLFHIFGALVPKALAYTPIQLNVGLGAGLVVQPIVRVIEYLFLTGAVVCSTIFLIGAFVLILGGVKEDWRSRGKDMMIGSLIGLFIILSSFAILRTVMFFIHSA